MHESATSIPDDPALLRAALMRMIAERDEIAVSRDAFAERVASLEHIRTVLEHQNRTLLERLYGRKSERLSDADLVLFHGFMQETLAKDGEADAAAAGIDAHKKGEKKRSGRPSGEAAIPRHLADAAVTVTHELPPEHRNCSSCGTEMQACGETSRITLEYLPARVTAVRHVRVGYQCEGCRTFAAAPAAPIPVQKSIASPGLLAAVIVGKHGDHLPLYRLEGILKRSGVDLPRQTTCGWMWPASRLLLPLVSLMTRSILAAPVILTDDTPVRMLDPGLGRTREARFWSYLAAVSGAGGVPERLVVYDFTRSRSHEHPLAFLKGFRGTLVSDAFGAYETLGRAAPDRMPVTNAGCWAHVRRKFKDALKLDERLCGEALARIATMYAAEQSCEERIEREMAESAQQENGQQENGAWPLDRLASRRAALRDEFVRPLVAETLSYLDSVRGRHVPKSDVTDAIEYVLKRREWFTRFLDDGRVPIDNNACERSLRGIAVGRRNWLFVGSEGGGQAASVFFSLLCSASLAEVEPYAYLKDVLERLARIRNERLLRTAQGKPEQPTDAELAELLPAAWLRANPQHRLPVNRS
jgi:transposase